MLAPIAIVAGCSSRKGNCTVESSSDFCSLDPEQPLYDSPYGTGFLGGDASETDAPDLDASDSEDGDASDTTDASGAREE